jgi:hypothetical protein
MSNILQLRPVERKRLDSLQERVENPISHDNIGSKRTKVPKVSQDFSIINHINKLYN